MDPLSIAAAASSLVVTVVRNGRALAIVFEKYQDSQRCIFLMQTECTVLAAALSQLQMFFSKIPKSTLSRYPEYVMEALDLSLVGCTLTLSILGKEIDNLLQSIQDSEAKMSKSKKIRYLWKEESMAELLQQLRGQSSALTLLLKALDMSSIEQILKIVQSGRQTFNEVREGSESIRRTHPEEDYAESILNMTFDDTATIYSVDTPQSRIDEQPIDTITSQLDSTTLVAQPVMPKVSASIPEKDLPQGWKTAYSAQYDQWYYIDTARGKSQWERPAVPVRNVQSPTSTQRSPILGRNPVAENNAGLTVPNIAGRGASSPAYSPNRTPEPRRNAEASIDFAPWKMNTEEKFQKALDNLRREASVAALAVGIVSAEGAPKIYVIGNRKADCSAPVSRADCFSIAMTNSITMAVTAILVDRGIFRWDETVQELFPAFAGRIHPFHHQTTLSTLGAHCSGMTAIIGSVEDGDLWRYIHQTSITAKKARFAVALSYLARPPDTTPNISSSWNWAGPILIAHAIEERTSSTLDSLIKTLVTDPLEMYSAGWGRPDARKNGLNPSSPSQPWGHASATKSPMNPADANLFNPLALNAATGLYCSAPDYASLARLYLRASMGLPQSMLSAQAAKYLFSPHNPGASYTPGNWWITSRDWAGGEAFLENGRCDGFAISNWLAPLKRKAYFAIANMDGDPGLSITDSAISLAIRHDAD